MHYRINRLQIDHAYRLTSKFLIDEVITDMCLYEARELCKFWAVIIKHILANDNILLTSICTETSPRLLCQIQIKNIFFFIFFLQLI